MSVPQPLEADGPWNKGLLIGQKKPLEPKHVWSIRVRVGNCRIKAGSCNL